MSAFDELGELRPVQLFPGFLARVLHGSRLTLAIVEIEPDAELPEHRHANEQFGLVLDGSLLFRVGNEERELGPGATWRIPSETPHAARGGPAGAVVVDVFSPPRDDWQATETVEPRPPRWP